MAPLYLASSSNVTILDKDRSYVATRLLKFDRDGANDIYESVDAHMPACIGNSRTVADKIANDVWRAKLLDCPNFRAVGWKSD